VDEKLQHSLLQREKATKIKRVMERMEQGKLRSGKGGPVVKNQKQAVAIAISEAKKK
jgi:hypothetical protein